MDRTTAHLLFCMMMTWVLMLHSSKLNVTAKKSQMLVKYLSNIFIYILFWKKKKALSLETLNISLNIWYRRWSSHKQYNWIIFLFLIYLWWLVCSQLSKNTLSQIEKEPITYEIHSQLALVEIGISIADERAGCTHCPSLAHWLPETWADQWILSFHFHRFISLFPVLYMLSFLIPDKPLVKENLINGIY